MGPEEGSAARLIDETFARIQVRMEDLLSTVEDSLRSTQDGLDGQVNNVIEDLSSKLKAAGLGVFTTKAVSIVKEEVQSGLSSKAVLSAVFDTIGEVRDEVGDIVTKASRGAVRSVGETTVNLRSRLVRLHARLSEKEQDLEAALANIGQLRSRVAELKVMLSSKTEAMAGSQQEVSRLKQVVSNLEEALETRDASISTLKGELQQANSQIDEQRNLLAKLDSAEELVTDYEEKTREVSVLKGRLAEANETISQRDSTIDILREEVGRLSNSTEQMSAKIGEFEENLAILRGEREAAKTEVEQLTAQITELEARWDTLYQVAEEEPGFKAYFVVADKKHWFELSHLSSALGVPVVLLKRQLQKFIDAGLLEIDGERIRPRNLSEVAQEAAGVDENLLEDAKASLDAASSQDPEDEVIQSEEESGENNDS